MSGIVYALVLMGCSDAGDQCQRLDYSGARHPTLEACMAASETALESPVALRADFPSVFTSCEMRGGTGKPPHLASRNGAGARRR